MVHQVQPRGGACSGAGPAGRNRHVGGAAPENWPVVSHMGTSMHCTTDRVQCVSKLSVLQLVAQSMHVDDDRPPESSHAAVYKMAPPLLPPDSALPGRRGR
jgi:hypothetical protein